ncbi:hypothetical protein V6N13_130755 [Hibiscus sabdariffa]
MFGGAWVVDRRIHVNIAKFNRISSYWRNVRPTTPLRNSSQVDKHKGVEFEEGECSKQQLKSNKRILGHVEDEVLWKMRRSLAREMAIVYLFIVGVTPPSKGLLSYVVHLNLLEKMHFALRTMKSRTVLVITNHVGKINEVVEMEFGNMVFDVCVVEIGFSDESLTPLKGAAKVASISGESSETGDNDPGPDQQVEGSDGANVLETGELENSIPAGN